MTLSSFQYSSPCGVSDRLFYRNLAACVLLPSPSRIPLLLILEWPLISRWLPCAKLALRSGRQPQPYYHCNCLQEFQDGIMKKGHSDQTSFRCDVSSKHTSPPLITIWILCCLMMICLHRRSCVGFSSQIQHTCCLIRISLQINQWLPRLILHNEMIQNTNDIILSACDRWWQHTQQPRYISERCVLLFRSQILHYGGARPPDFFSHELSAPSFFCQTFWPWPKLSIAYLE